MSFDPVQTTTPTSLEPLRSTGLVWLIAPFTPSGTADSVRERLANTGARVQDMGSPSHGCLDLSPKEVPTSHRDP